MVWARDILSQLYHAPKLTGFDVVQIMTPKFFNWKIQGAMLRFLKRHNRKLVVIDTACTSDYHRRVKQLRHSACKQCLFHDFKAERCIYDTPDEQRAEHLSLDAADAVVVTHFEYLWSLGDTRFADKLAGISLPIDIERHQPSPMPPIDKIRIWYGETRHGFKGGPFIVEALDRLAASELADRVEIVRTGRLPYDEYLSMIDSVHVVVDQASAYSVGMNALYALARGRVTLSGAEPEALEFIGVGTDENPVIAIRPDADQIYDALAGLVERKAELPELGRRSAAYVAKYHAADVIARQYEALYARLLEPVAARLPT